MGNWRLFIVEPVPSTSDFFTVVEIEDVTSSHDVPFVDCSNVNLDGSQNQILFSISESINAISANEGVPKFILAIFEAATYGFIAYAPGALFILAEGTIPVVKLLAFVVSTFFTLLNPTCALVTWCGLFVAAI